MRRAPAGPHALLATGLGPLTALVVDPRSPLYRPYPNAARFAALDALATLEAAARPSREPARPRDGRGVRARVAVRRAAPQNAG